jgi:GTP-binding protein HflX
MVGGPPPHDHATDAQGDGAVAGQGARERVWISARDGVGLDALRQALGARLGLRRVQGELRLPPQAGRLRARLHELDAVRGEEHDEDGWRLRLDLAEADALRVASQPWGEPVRALLVDHPEPAR